MSYPTLVRLEQAFGMPSKKWAGKCYAVACAASKLVAKSRPIYGHYLGKVCPTSMFATDDQLHELGKSLCFMGRVRAELVIGEAKRRGLV